ncbi:uncharacterized protein [Aristolochia californica]|uniref:uncharacterized protein n=1 Tax=Aristolochia californica TaxID=171875 RepID=UPI0035DEB4A0
MWGRQKEGPERGDPRGETQEGKPERSNHRDRKKKGSIKADVTKILHQVFGTVVGEARIKCISLFSMAQTGEERKLQLNELEEIRHDAYENAKLGRRKKGSGEGRPERGKCEEKIETENKIEDFDRKQGRTREELRSDPRRLLRCQLRFPTILRHRLRIFDHSRSDSDSDRDSREPSRACDYKLSTLWAIPTFLSLSSSNPLGELINYKQTGSLEVYQKTFEEWLAGANKFVSHPQYIHIFIAGLTEALRQKVELHGPIYLDHAMNLAWSIEHKQHVLKDSLVRKPAWLGRHNATAPTPYYGPPRSGASVAPRPDNSNSTPPTLYFKKLNRQEMDQRRAKGLCFNCDEQYVQGHLCKRLFSICLWEDGEDILPEEEIVETDQEGPEISLHAMTGLRSYSTMQVKAQLHHLQLLALVDFGSTHNFINQPAVEQLGLVVQQQTGLSVSVANGAKITSVGFSQTTYSDIEGHAFIAYFLVIPLSGFNLVLGIKWLQLLGPILWDFQALTMSFTEDQHHITLHGTQAPVPCALLEPTALPPIRHCDHRIHLKMGTEPIVVHPYRYPHLQKDEIERQCQKMLAQGITQPSRSPFSSPLDLKSGYHQIRVHPSDVEKTAFCMHHGHFEFLVLPFGLSNAPSTFQSKCSMGTSEVAYLGHVISTIGVKVNQTLRGFLGLAGYYWKFIHSYGQIVEPLNDLLKKNVFTWSKTAAHSFQQLKKALSSAPGHPIANFSRQLGQHHHKLAVYERGLIGLAKGIQQWQPYLWGHPFLIHTDHFILKYLLEQRLTTSPQQHWLSKLMGFDFTVEYKPGSLNVGVYALSHWDIPEPQLHAISQPIALLLDSIREETQQYPEIIALYHDIQ